MQRFRCLQEDLEQQHLAMCGRGRCVATKKVPTKEASCVTPKEKTKTRRRVAGRRISRIGIENAYILRQVNGGNYGRSAAVGSHKFLLVGASSTCFLSLLEDKTTTSSLYCLCINNLAQVRESPKHLPFTVQTKPLVACDT